MANDLSTLGTAHPGGTVPLQTISRLAAILVAATGALVLVGWAFHVTLLKSVFAGLVPMRPNAALGFLLSGAALFLLSRHNREGAISRYRHLLGRGYAAIVVLLGVLTLSQYLFGWDLGIDRALFPVAVAAEPAPFPGRMAPHTALNFILLGAALLLLDVRGRARNTALWLALPATGIALVVCFEYLFNLIALQESPPYIRMALNAAFSFLVLGLGILLARLQHFEQISFRLKLAVGFGLAVSLLVLVGATSYRSILASGEHNRLVANTYEVLKTLESVLLNITEAESARRGFELTSQERFLEKYHSGLRELQQELPKLQRLIADNPDQQRRLALLVPLIERRLDLLAEAIALHQRTPAEVAAQFRLTARGKEVMDQIRSAIAEMKREEHELLARRAEAAAASARQTQTIIVAGTSLALSLAFISGFILHREMTVRRRAEDRFRTLLEAAPDSMIIVDARGSITLVNAQAESLFGYLRAELLGQPIELLVPERFRQGHPGYRMDFFSKPAPRSMGVGRELFALHKDGAEFPVEISLSPFQTHEGRFVTASVRDITERKRIEQQIRILGERFERFFTASIDLFAIAGSDGYFKRLNPAWETTLGFTSDELLARPYVEFVHPEDRERTLAEAEQLRAGVETLAFENRYLCKDGSYRWLLWSARFEPESQLIYASARDLTERRRAADDLARLNRDLQHHAAELEAANKELETFTYSVSHDLRAPLRHIDGFSRILLDDYSDSLDPDARKFLGLIRDSTQHMGRLVDDLLNLSRISRQEARPQIVGLATLVEEVLVGLRPELADRNIEWQIGNLPFVECDPGLVKQVLANLLSNAVKYTRPRNPAVVSVGVVDPSDPPVIFVRDNGVGFSMKYADKLFGVFQRLHRQEDFEGTGVGLATVQRIIHKHGGRIWAEAELDGGATFFFTLSSAHPQPVGEQFLQRGVS